MMLYSAKAVVADRAGDVRELAAKERGMKT
jgi:hypothetical protein